MRVLFGGFDALRLRRLRRLLLVALALAAPAVLAAPAAAAQQKPVPSLQPAATAKLWKQLVRQPRPFALRRLADCRPLRAVFYTSTDWLRLATKLAATPAACADYYISIPPLAADKTAFRYDQPWRIRALGPQFHVLAEINYTGWSKWVTANNATWYDAGVEARRRMASSGFDVASGDTWVVNEFSSAVRAGTGSARDNVRDLVRGLYEGGGTVPQVKGAVFIVGMGQGTSDLSTYKYNLQNWYVDTPFWQAMSAYVEDWSQEVYGDFRLYGVAGASPADRGTQLNDYLGHALTLANAAPAEAGAAAASSFLRAAHSPLANAAWQYESAFGWTAVPYNQMQDYVSAQTYALRSFDRANGRAGDRFGFAWAPKMLDGSAWTTDFNTQSALVLDRLAAAIRDSSTTPEGACGTAWCTASIDGARFVQTWKTFATWSPPALALPTNPSPLTAGVASGALTVRLQQVGLAQPAQSPVTVRLATTSPGGGFATAPDGPWSSSLDVVVATGSSDATFYYRDTRAGNATVTAAADGRSSATQNVTVVAGAAATVTVAPGSATLAAGAAQAFTASAADAYGNAVAAAATWSLGADTPGTLSTTSGASTTFTASAATGGSGSVVATVGALTATASVTVTAPKLQVASIAYSGAGKTLTLTATVVRSSDGARVAGATVALTLTRDAATVATPTLTTGSTGTATYSTTLQKGCYTTTVRSASGAGLAWDGVTPANRYCK